MKRAASWSLGAALALLSLFPPLTTTARNYSICEEWVGHDFLDQFFFWDYTDPTQGKVDYVNQGTAKKLNLTYVNPVTNQFVMQVDTDHDAVSLNGNKSDLGRRSVRLHSNRAYGDGVYILKASWIPQGCGTWPAFWTSTPNNWPNGGEIDIVEGVNGMDANLASMHTAGSCNVPTNVTTTQQGTLQQSNCTDQPGCATRFNNPASFGTGFNQK